ncbi:hypothetical protein BP5796_10541 [Coleophoma crateriformis]|uniref:Uncharacterized protein n=1 Tax=Coleophoma crateriformis TaxID=565419 RepID=A0A3D8QQF3_9HELO|nr:hypothetical protein BP5796_10541 [Coleophoma crateriformis]
MEEVPRGQKRHREASEDGTRRVRASWPEPEFYADSTDQVMPRKPQTSPAPGFIADVTEQDFQVMSQKPQTSSVPGFSADGTGQDFMLKDEHEHQTSLDPGFNADGTDDEEDLDLACQEDLNPNQPCPFQLWPSELIEKIFHELYWNQCDIFDDFDQAHAMLSLGLTCGRFYFIMQRHMKKLDIFCRLPFYFNVDHSDDHQADDVIGEFLGPEYRLATHHVAYDYDRPCRLPGLDQRTTVLPVPMFVKTSVYGLEYSKEEREMEYRYIDFENITPPFNDHDDDGNLIDHPKTHIILPYNKGPAWSKRMYKLYLDFAGYLDVAYDVWYPAECRLTGRDPNGKRFKDYCSDRTWMRTRFYRLYYRRESLKKLADFLEMTGM